MGERNGGDDAIAGSEAERRGDVGRLGLDVGVRQDDSLGRSGRAGRELHERGAREVGGLPAGRSGDQCERRQPLDGQRARRAAGGAGDARRVALGGHDQRGRQPGDHGAELGRAERRRYENDGRPGVPGSRERGQERACLIQRERDDPAGAEAGRGQRRRRACRRRDAGRSLRGRRRASTTRVRSMARASVMPLTLGQTCG